MMYMQPCLNLESTISLNLSPCGHSLLNHNLACHETQIGQKQSLSMPTGTFHIYSCCVLLRTICDNYLKVLMRTKYQKSVCQELQTIYSRMSSEAFSQHLIFLGEHVPRRSCCCVLIPPVLCPACVCLPERGQGLGTRLLYHCETLATQLLNSLLQLCFQNGCTHILNQERIRMATRVRACNSNRSPQSGRSFPLVLKIELWSRARIAILTFYTACGVCVTVLAGNSALFRFLRSYTQLNVHG